MVKIEIFIPCSHFEVLQEALRSVGAGSFGKYDSALSYSPVKGCWRPLEGASPHVGEIGVLQYADEYKVEVCAFEENLEKTIDAIRTAHPYETPVINVIPLIKV